MSWVDNPQIVHLRPYLKVIRIDNITGFFLLLWPCLWSITFASEGDIPVLMFIIFALGAFVMRSAGCVINDLVDRKLDAKVERTKDRPLSTGSLKLYEAVLLLFLLLTIAGMILLSLSSTAIMLGYIIVIPIFIYPFMKRITYWPQIFLAFTINWGVLMGWAAVRDELSITAAMVYAACIFWTLGYDTIYAHQDKEDDMLLGIKSTALKFGVYTKKYLYSFYLITIILLWVVGIMQGSGLLFHVFLMLCAFQLFWQVKTVDLSDPVSCMRIFSSNRYFGAMMFAGILVGKVAF